MIRYRPFSPPELYDYTFLAIYGEHSEIPMKRILDAIDAPNRYRRHLENLPKIPEKISPSFVAALARKEGVSASVLGYHPVIRRTAKKLGVWDRPLDLGVTPLKLMDRGFRGKALGEELDRLYREKIKELDAGISGKEKV